MSPLGRLILEIVSINPFFSLPDGMELFVPEDMWRYFLKLSEMSRLEVMP